MPMLVAVGVGSLTWAALSAWQDSHIWHRLTHHSLSFLAPLTESVSEIFDLPPSLLIDEGISENHASTATPLPAETVPAGLPGTAPLAEAAPPAPLPPRGAANEPAEIVIVTPTQPPELRSEQHENAVMTAALNMPPPGDPHAPLTAATSPLAPLDTSSPRATLRSFRDTADRIFRNMRGGLSAETRVENNHLLAQTLTCLDLTEFAPTLATSKGREAATCLKEVFDRIPLPADAAIPDAAAVKTDSITRWRIPGTEIMLVRIDSGPRQGDFVFAPETVTRAESFFVRVRNRPYKPDAGSPGLYEAYVTVGGNLIPESFIRSLPAWAHSVVLGETVWQWCAAVLLAVTFGLVAFLASSLPQLFRPGWARSITSFLLPVVLAVGSLVADWLITFQVRLTGDSLIAAKLSLRLTLYAGAIAAVMAVMSRITEILVRARNRRGDGIDVQLIRLACRVCTFVVVAWIGIQAADSLGVPVAPLLAGLGASGLAVALAAQYSIENLIAGVVLFTDKPVRIGDECQYGDVRGRVEQIGLRSTRIRGVDRSLITIPNAEFAKVQLVNYTRRDRIPITLPVEIRPDASPAQVRDLLSRFRDLLGDHARLDPGSPRVRLTGQSSAAYTIEISALALTADDGEMHTIREEILLAIMDEIERRHCGMPGDDTGSPLLRAA
jgi:MscS family membrane protein